MNSSRSFIFQPLRLFLLLSILTGLFFSPAVVSQFALAAPASEEILPAPLATLNVIDPPTITLGGLGNAMIGSQVTFSVTFDNNDPENETGYGPFIEIELPTIGADGAGSATDDGLTFVGATFLGAPVLPENLSVVTLNSSGQATHPFVRDTSGNFITITGTAGNQVVFIRKPLGSFTPGQPPVTVNVTVQMSNLADLGIPLNIRARGGYQYGFTPLDDWCCESIPLTLSGYTTGSIIPIVMTLNKTYSGPANTSAETATGPNFTQQYTVSVDIAAGQTVTDLTITDTLPNNEQYVPIATGSPGGYTLVEVPVSGAAQNPPGNDLVVRWASITGGSGTSDASTTFSFFVPSMDADGNPVINSTTGNAASSCNNASVSGTWTPIDTRDLPASVQTINIAGCEHTLTVRSIATQKSVAVIGGNLEPGRSLEYTLEVQISDFFAFDTTTLTDIISDGQSFDSGFTPRMSVNGNGFSLGPAAMSSYSVVSNKNLLDGPPPAPENPASDGTTSISFNISGELAVRATSLSPGDASNHALAGRLLGGCVPLTGSSTPDCSTYNDGGTTVTLVFRTVVDENFSDVYPSGDWSVDQGDILTNTESVTGNVLNTNTFVSTGSTESDYAGASLSIATGSLSKEIYAINGTICPDAVVCPSSGPYRIKPSDTVTYRLTYSMPISDEENLQLTDYLPLPIYNATEINTFSSVVSAAAPPAGTAKFGPTDTFYTYSGITPVMTTSSVNNSVDFYYGDYDNTANQSTTVDLLFTVTVTTLPFADGLYLTNLAHANEGSTNGGEIASDAIVQVILTEPVLATSKSVIYTNNPNAIFSPTSPAPPVTFLDPTNSPRWSGTINSTNLSSGGAFTIDHDITGVDAGDIVSFAIVIENQGSSLKGAFDIDILDTLPANFKVPGSGLNLQIYYGNGTGPISYTRPDNTAATPGDLFTTGIRLIDPVSAGVCQAHDPNSGNNVILITYDLEVKDTVTPGTMTNTATITHYAGSEGGPNHVPTPSPIHDDADATTVTSIAKTLIGTEINNATNSNFQAVIGELATYQLVVTVPEGVVPAGRIEDTLDSGLAFMDLISVVISDPDTDGAGPDTGLSSIVMMFDSTTGICTNCTAGTTAGTSNPLIASSGGTITFDLGGVTNSNRVNTTPETITLTYRVVVLNTNGNQQDSQLNNSAVYSWTGGSQTVSAENVTVIEPVVAITKTISPNVGDAGDSFTYTITLTGPTVTDAFEVTLEDPFPLLMENIAWGATPVSDNASLVTQANFSLTGNNTIGYTLSTVIPFDMLTVNIPRTITLTFTGTVSYLANPQQQIDNVGTVRWTSLDTTVNDRSTFNTNSDERTGSEITALNDYFASNSASAARFTVNTVDTDKYTILTSEASTADNTNPWHVTIGEVIRYRLVMPLPEGTSPNFQVRDNLPTGLTFLNDNTTKAAFVSTSGITSNAVGIVPGISDIDCNLTGSTADGANPAIPALCDSLANNNIGSNNSTTDNQDEYNSGTDPYFKLGTLVNNDSDSDQEFVVLEFNALVDNSSAGSNDAGDDLNNTFNVFIGGAQVGTPSNSVLVRVAEPSITDLDKTATPASGDAGDVITYTLTFSNANGANNTTAFNVVITDTVPAKMTANLGGMTVNSPSSCATGVDTSNSSGNNVDIRIAVVPAGCSVIVSYTATLNDTVTPQEVLANTADITYTSLPGPFGTTSNPTGSSTPGTSGTNTGERNGSNGARPWNDYHDQDTANVTIPNVVIAKQLTVTSASHTSGSDVAIGEVVTYAVLLTFPEGTTPADTILDDLPSGLEVAGTPEIITIAADSGGLLTADFNGTIGGQSITSILGDGGSVKFDFTNVVTNEDSNDNTNNMILMRFQARVNNILANQSSLSISNQATNQVGTNPVTTSNSVNVTVVEPVITFGKIIVSTPTPLDAGGVVHYRITYANGTGATVSTAMDVHIIDALATVLLLPSTGAPHFVITPTAGVGAITNNSTTSNIDITIASVPAGESVTVDFYPVIQSSISPGQIVDNIGNSTWTSLSGTVTGERDGSGGVNDYNASSTVSFTVDDPAFSKSIDLTDNPSTINPQVAIGETITFHLNVTLPEGTTSGITIDDDLPTGLRYVLNSASLDTTGFNGTVNSWSVTPTLPPVGSGDDLRITIGQVDVVVDNDDTNNSFYIAFDATVLNETGNQASPPPLTNSATMTIGADTFTDTEDVSIVEPVLTILKSVNDAYPGPNQPLDFTLTVTNSAPASNATAHDVVIFDDLPAELALDLTSVSYSLAGGATVGAAPDNSSGNRVEIRVLTIPVGGSVTVTFQATTSGTVTPSDAIVNTGNVTWTSMPGTPSEERTGTGGNPNDYNASSTLTLNTDKRILKTVTATNHLDSVYPEVAIGELVTYQILLDFPKPASGSVVTSGVSLIDQLDTGLAFVQCLSITPSDPGINSSIPMGTVCASPVVTAIGAPAAPSSAGRQVLFDFGDVTVNAGSSGQLTLLYQVVVLDVAENQSGGTNTPNNNAEFRWDLGSLRTSGPDDLVMVEPFLQLEKTTNTSFGFPGDPITFTLTINYDTASSTADAYDVLLTDVIPVDLTLVGSPVNVSGIAPTSITVTGSTIQVYWDYFPRQPVGESVIEFTATLGNLGPGSSVSNTASVEWTSLPGNPGIQSLYNNYSTERRYDPLSPVDIYGVTASATVRVPELPDTGFAPGVQTEISAQPHDKTYTTLGDMWLEIQVLDLKLPIVGVPATSDGDSWDVTWLDKNAGWLEGTAFPTWKGNSVITSHVYLPNGQPGPFVDLSTLKFGDRVIVSAYGQDYIYEVRTVKTVKPDDTSRVIRHEELPWITLLTCKDYDSRTDTYRNRIAVRAVLVSISDK